MFACFTTRGYRLVQESPSLTDKKRRFSVQVQLHFFVANMSTGHYWLLYTWYMGFSTALDPEHRFFAQISIPS